MADGATAVSGGTSPVAGQTIDSVLKGAQSHADDVSKAATDESGQLGAADKQETAQLQKTEEDRFRLKPPELTIPESPKVQPTDPKQIWGSMAMALAALGSLMTRTPLTTAMNAAADVMDSYRKNDVAAANQAFATWKQASENYVKLADFQQKSYDQALAHYDKLDQLTIEEHGNRVREIEAEFRAQATAYGDRVALDKFEANGIKGVQELSLQREKWRTQMEIQIPKIEQAHAFMQASAKLMADPRFQQLQQEDPAAAYRLLNGLMPSSMKPMTQEQGLQAENHIRDKIETSPLFKSWSAAQISSQEIDQTLSQVHNGSISSAVAADQFTQTFNGGRAIRGFQMAMLSDHASLWDQANVLAKKVESGGGLSDDQLATMAQAAKMSADYLNRALVADVKGAQAIAAKQHLDIDAVVPPQVVAFANENPGSMPGLSLPGGQPKQIKAVDGKPIPPEAIEAMKAHKDDPVYRRSFGKHFGEQALAQVVGQ